MSPAAEFLAALRVADDDVYKITHPAGPYDPTRIYTRHLIPGLTYITEGRRHIHRTVRPGGLVEIISHPRQEQHA